DIAFPTAGALIRGQLGVEEVTDSGLSDPAIRSLASKVEVEECEEFNQAFPERRFAELSISLADGRTIKSEVTEAPGDPEMPLSNEQLVDKAKGYLTMAIGAADAAAMCQAVGDFADPNFNLAAMLKILYRPIDR